MNEPWVPEAAERGVFIEWGRRKARSVWGGEAWDRQVIENKGAVDCSAAETLIQVRGENVSSVRVYGDYWELGEPVKHGVMKSGRKDMQRVLERGIRDEIYADSSIVANIDSASIELLLWVRYCGKGLAYTSSFTLHANLWSRYNYHFVSREAEGW